MMAKAYGLGRLQMGEAGHQAVCMVLGLLQQGVLQRVQLVNDARTGTATIETKIGCHLVVARAGRMQATGRVANNPMKARFNIHVNIFKVRRKGKLPLFNLGSDLLQALINSFAVLF